MPTKINIFKDTIDIKEAKHIALLTLFIIQKHPGIGYFRAYDSAEEKLKEINFYHNAIRSNNA